MECYELYEEYVLECMAEHRGFVSYAEWLDKGGCC